jgi:hypothetical protein
LCNSFGPVPQWALTAVEVTAGFIIIIRDIIETFVIAFLTRRTWVQYRNKNGKIDGLNTMLNAITNKGVFGEC